ncbi:MAG: DUF3857 domain-containing protein [Bacteroidetes bacterium]|nr:DUF3857 domain-containing protein [Bacteroidota bacterium]
MRLIAPVVLCLFISTVSFSQEKLNIKFGKITPADFEVNSPLIDSNTNAILHADIGTTEFEGNNKNWFTMVFRRHKRIKILNNKGFDAATLSIYLYSQNNEVEKLDELKAQTYNLENNSVVITKLSSKDIFEEKVKRNLIKKKLTLPAVKVGSIIEVSYTIKSDFLFNLQPWEFQGEYPCLWSEYDLALPDFFNYVFLSQGYLPFDINTTTKGYNNYVVRDPTTANIGTGYNIGSDVLNKKWVIKNAAAMKEENFTSTIANHISKIEFQLSEYRFPNQPVEKIMQSWPKVAEKMMGSIDFGLAITRSNDWLSDDINKITANAKTEEERAKKIYEYIRDNFTSTGDYGLYLSDNTNLKDIFKRKSGKSCEINLLLLAMLYHNNITCSPVLMSLRDRGTVHMVYPLMDRFNYLIAKVQVGQNILFLDASKPMLGFNQLSSDCYNGVAWSITKEMQEPLYFYTDSVKESNYTTVLLSNEKEGIVKGTFSEVLGNSTSLSIREKIKKTNLTSITNEIKKSMSGDIKVSNLSIDSLNSYDEPVTLKYDLEMNAETDIIYLNPMFGEAIQKNPFSSAKRNYPIEMPYLKDDHFVLNMEIPAGYKVEEMPKSVRYKLNEDDGMFEYLIANRDGRIQIRSSIKLNKANFSMDDYEGLREFYAFIIKQQNEQIVLKKVK